MIIVILLLIVAGYLFYLAMVRFKREPDTRLHVQDLPSLGNRKDDGRDDSGTSEI